MAPPSGDLPQMPRPFCQWSPYQKQRITLWKYHDLIYRTCFNMVDIRIYQGLSISIWLSWMYIISRMLDINWCDLIECTYIIIYLEMCLILCRYNNGTRGHGVKVPKLWYDGMDWIIRIIKPQQLATDHFLRSLSTGASSNIFTAKFCTSCHWPGKINGWLAGWNGGPWAKYVAIVMEDPQLMSTCIGA